MAAQLSRYPVLVGGVHANVRAKEFEKQVQALLDETPLAARPEWREYSQRILRIDGQDVTDIDAVFEYDGDVVLVSCKSIPDSEDLERGDPQVIRRVARRVEDDVDAWRHKVERFQQCRRGDNYDLSGAGNVVGVVVYPKHLFVPIGPATDEALPGLPVATTAGELQEWAINDLDVFGKDNSESPHTSD